MKSVLSIVSILALYLGALNPLNAQAPIIEDSDNYMGADEDYPSKNQSIAKSQFYNEGNEDELENLNPLVQDDKSSINEAANTEEKLQTLQQEIQELRGQLEIQAHDLKRLQQQQLAFYKDIDNRLQPNSTDKHPENTNINSDLNPQNNTNADSEASYPKGNPADEQISYLAAYELVKNKHFDEAERAFQKFIHQYPQGGYSANAHYWLGELHLVKKNNEAALVDFKTVINQFPSSSKAAASQLKIAYVYINLGKPLEARTQLQKVLQNYPDTPAARMAGNKLESLQRP